MPPNHPELQQIAQDLQRHLRWQEEVGGSVLFSDRTHPLPQQPPPPQRAGTGGQLARPVNDAPAVPQRTQATAKTPRSAVAPARDLVVPVPVAQALGGGPEGVRTLDEVRRELGDCTRCKLCQGRKQIVFGTGNPKAELVFVGEGPGAEEDAQGIPFVGAAGQLLTKMIDAMGFQRDQVYICNVVKCRPPGNRNPEPDEIAACEPFLVAQLQAIRPKVIVALGKFAVQTLLRDQTAITRMRGRWREYQGIPLMPTFHPAYLLRNPAEKKSAWADLQQVMKVFGKTSRKAEEG